MEENYKYLAFAVVALLLVFKFLKMKKMQKLLGEYMKKDALIIDVRSPEEFAQGANPKSKNMPLDSLNETSKKLNKDQAIIVCCASGMRSAMALNILKRQGFKDVLNAGPWQKTLGN